MATRDGSFASSPKSLSAGGQEEQPWLVNNSTTARVCACAEEHRNAAAETAASAQARQYPIIPRHCRCAGRSPATQIAVRRPEDRRQRTGQKSYASCHRSFVLR